MKTPIRQLIDAIRGDPAYDIDWARVVALASRHRVIPLLYHKTKAFIPSPHRETLYKRFYANVARTEVLARELTSVYSLLFENGVHVLPYKGPVLAQLVHGDTAMRQYDDLDFIVWRTDTLLARQLLLERGYEETLPLNSRQAKIFLLTGQEWVFWHPLKRTYLDMKAMMVSHLMSSEREAEAVFFRRQILHVGEYNLPTLSPEDTFLCCCLHGVINRWHPLQHLLDAVAIVNRTTLDWPQLLKQAASAGATRMVLHTVALACHFFDIQPPRNIADLAARDTAGRSLTDEVISDIESGKLACRRGRRWFYKLRSWQGLKNRIRFILRQALVPSRQIVGRLPI